jgi:fatty acid CoA ligase FadD9
MPMSHAAGRGVLYGTLGNGGTAYFAAKNDLSTMLEDLALVRPTELTFVPRIWDMLFGEFQSELDRRSSDGADRAALEAEVIEQQSGSKRPTFATVHGRDATELHGRDLTLDKFIDAQTLETAPTLPPPSDEVRTVLLTGATGFLGRYLALEWLERMALVGGTVICLVRAKSNEDARRRLDKTFDGGDPELLAHYRELAADHLEVIAGDKGEPNLGLDQATWQRLADTVDLIVDPAALVNHVLPYSQLFGPNALGTAELIRIALTTKLKPFSHVSTIGVCAGIEPPSLFTEDADIRVISPTRAVDDSYDTRLDSRKVPAKHPRCLT